MIRTISGVWRPSWPETIRSLVDAVPAYGETGNGIEDTGELALHLDTGGVTLGNVSYQIAGPGGFSRSGTVDVGHDHLEHHQRASRGQWLHDYLTAVAGDGTTTCAGSATFNVAPHVNIAVTVPHLTCREAARTAAPR